MSTPLSVFWFRRDLRLHDNAGLYHALRSGRPVLPVFIFDRNILDALEQKNDARVEFIHNRLCALKEELEARGSTLWVKVGSPDAVWKQLIAEHPVAKVFTNRDYEPYAEARDASVEKLLSAQRIPLRTFKDHVIFEKDEVVKDDGKPYTVFTPYSRKWLARLAAGVEQDPSSGVDAGPLASYPSERHADRFLAAPPVALPTLESIGFEPSGIAFPPDEIPRERIRHYDQTRDFPALNGTSRLGVHFRFGTISIREKARKARDLNKTYLNELIWRDFYSQILAHFPHTATRAFRPEYDRIEWRDAPGDFRRWCDGQTGYPLVDAGMRELLATGYMHNRVRMVTASFLSKHLLIDWRLGETWFAGKLLDYDMASNVGGWQWAAGCGTDAAPYFRIFNPVEQQKKFDREFAYIKRWVPEWGTTAYSAPVVEHAFARQRCLDVYRRALGEKG